MTSAHRITAGFMPLLDSALLVAAKEMGFAVAEGVELTLIRETSWANIRDRLAQAYGPAHGIVTRSNENGGFSVILDIPFDGRDDRTHKEPA